jgi:hypothetical protein
LNFGDCCTYATASIAGERLLCVGDDFRQTDLPLVSLDDGDDPGLTQMACVEGRVRSNAGRLGQACSSRHRSGARSRLSLRAVLAAQIDAELFRLSARAPSLHRVQVCPLADPERGSAEGPVAVCPWWR